MRPLKIAILISGTGTNAKRLIQFEPLANISKFVLISAKNNQDIFEFCSTKSIKYIELLNGSVSLNEEIESVCLEEEVTYIVLAGFLKKISASLIQTYKNRILNLHPSLLPKFGGKGMFGRHVHQAVYEANERESGITIHEVSEIYDEGRIVAQFKVPISEEDSAENIENKVRLLEYEYFPQTVYHFVIG
jgi:phosphoribosylglycinamide formyltransferase 1